MVGLTRSRIVTVVLLGSLILPARCTDVKSHDKRQMNAPYYFQPQQSKLQSQYPLTRPYFPDPRYQYNPGYRNAGQANQQAKLLQPGLATSPYAQAIKPQSRGQYVSYYYPHRTHYKDWSRKVLAATAYARKLQIARQQQMFGRNQKPVQGNAGIKLFVAGVKPNGNLHGQWINQNNFQNTNDQRNQRLGLSKPLQQNAASVTGSRSPGSMRPVKQNSSPATTASINSGISFNKLSFSKFQPQLTMNPISQDFNPVSPTGEKPNSKTPNVNSGKLNVGGASNPNHQLQTQANPPLDKGSTAKANLLEAILSDNLGGAVLGPNAHSLLQSDTSQPTPQSELTQSNKTQVQTVQPQKGVTLNTVHIDETTGQKLITGQASVPAPESKWHLRPSQPSPSIPNGAPNNKNSLTHYNSPGYSNPNQTSLDRELALKKLLFPATAAAKTQVIQTVPRVSSQAAINEVSPPQVVPSFPAFRYDANHSDVRRNSYNSHRTNNIPHAPSVTNVKAFLEQKHNLVPYKGSFPLTLHKISPYFKMKRNLKQLSGGQAKARRRFLELQTNK